MIRDLFADNGFFSNPPASDIGGNMSGVLFNYVRREEYWHLVNIAGDPYQAAIGGLMSMMTWRLPDLLMTVTRPR